jgi:hypothetical protein
MKSPIIDVLITKMKEEYSKSEPVFKPGDFTADDMKFLRDECTKKSEFDPYNKRFQMYMKFMSGDYPVHVKEYEYGKIITIIPSLDIVNDIPWGLWGRILRIYSEQIDDKFRVFFLPDSSLREFPEIPYPITPSNINGGYTYSCNKTTIMVYRAEDATRVLIHELLHACCLDKHENGVDIVESETEAWAELIYIGLISEGKKYIFNSLLQRQSEYMRKQNKKVQEYITPNSMDFPWRYTIGKEEVWKRWGILVEQNAVPYIRVGNSLRLTYPPDSILKQRFKVTEQSTIL